MCNKESGTFNKLTAQILFFHAAILMQANAAFGY